MAENWDNVRSSGQYYYGMGHGDSEEEAMRIAISELTGMIATHVSSDFTGLTNETNANGQIDHQSQVLNCVKTYSQATLRNVEKWAEKKGNEYVAYCYMKRTELEKIYVERINKAKDMLDIAAQALEKNKIDMALQYYYWSYSLIRSVQRPNEITGSDGKILVNWIPICIDEILSDISVAFEKKEDDFVDLLFSYKGKPVSSLEYTYNDGRAMCQGTAKDGRGMMEMIPNYETSTYHLNIEYEYKGQARGDAEMQSVLNVITRKVFPKAEVKVAGRSKATAAKPHHGGRDVTGVNLKPKQSQVVTNASQQTEAVSKVIDAIQRKTYSDANSCFTLDGLEMYNKLIAYGTGRVVGTPNLKFFKSANGNTVARGLQMSFSFNSGTKKTFVEDVAFTINKENKIESVAFGLGQIAENDILCRHAPGWTDETRELLMEFLESYKTAYCLKRIDYIRNIFADDAVIIIGNVARRNTAKQGDGDRMISLGGQEKINYNRYTKDEYLKNLERCFRRNEFINIRFTNNDIQWLEKYKNRPDTKELFAIQIGQEYNSTSYGDKGYLFLLVNLTDHDNPQIKIRTWQPNEVDVSKVYNAGDFYDE
jgi:hypothetical protein